MHTNSINIQNHVDHVDHLADHGYHNVNHMDHMVDNIYHVVDHVVDHVDHVVDHVVDYVDSVNQEDKEDDLDNDLQLIVEKHEKGSKVIIDLINLNNKYDIDNRWKIMAQICSYSILFKDSENLLVSVEKFMMLINDTTIANSEIVTVRIIYIHLNYLLFCFVHNIIKIHVHF